MSIALATAPNTPATFISVGTETSADPIVWFLDQVQYLLELDDPPHVFLHDLALPESSFDADRSEERRVGKECRN